MAGKLRQTERSLELKAGNLAGHAGAAERGAAEDVPGLPALLGRGLVRAVRAEIPV